MSTPNVVNCTLPNRQLPDLGIDLHTLFAINQAAARLSERLGLGPVACGMTNRPKEGLVSVLFSDSFQSSSCFGALEVEIGGTIRYIPVVSSPFPSTTMEA